MRRVALVGAAIIILAILIAAAYLLPEPSEARRRGGEPRRPHGRPAR